MAEENNVYRSENNDWYRWDTGHYDKLPKRVRAAVRAYPLNIDCGELRKQAKSQDEMLRMLAENRAPT